MAQTPAARRWSALIVKQGSSGLTMKACAVKHDVNSRTLSWWRSPLKREQSNKESDTVVELEVTGPVPAPDRSVVLALDDLAVHVVVDDDTNLDLLKTVLAALC